jgi:hypothetical protein
MCIICSGNIDEARSTPSDGLAFACSTHGAYVVARSALPRFLTMDTDNRDAALKRAKLFADRRSGEVIITSMDL